MNSLTSDQILFLLKVVDSPLLIHGDLKDVPFDSKVVQALEPEIAKLTASVIIHLGLSLDNTGIKIQNSVSVPQLSSWYETVGLRIPNSKRASIYDALKYIEDNGRLYLRLRSKYNPDIDGIAARFEGNDGFLNPTIDYDLSSLTDFDLMDLLGLDETHQLDRLGLIRTAHLKYYPKGKWMIGLGTETLRIYRDGQDWKGTNAVQDFIKHVPYSIAWYLVLAKLCPAYAPTYLGLTPSDQSLKLLEKSYLQLLLAVKQAERETGTGYRFSDHFAVLNEQLDF